MKSFLFIGLGNPGTEYHTTRHNIGERVLKAWMESVTSQAIGFKDWNVDESVQAEIAEVVLSGNTKITAMFPQTYMNNSGDAVQLFLHSNNREIDFILIIQDELELSFGEVNIKEGGSAQGHNGIRSIHQAIETQDIARLQIGIGRPIDQTPVNRFVLQKFTAEEEKLLSSTVIPHSIKILTQVITQRQFQE